MIQGFFTVIQQDMTCIGDYFKDFSSYDEEGQKKVNRAALRMFAVLGMGCSAIIGVRAFQAKTTIGTLRNLVTAVSLYVLCHDVFVMLVNSEKGLIDHMSAVGKGFIADMKDLFNGKKSLNDAPRHPFTEGTFVRPFWDLFF